MLTICEKKISAYIRIIFFVNSTQWNKLKELVWHLVLYELEEQPLNHFYQHVVEVVHFRLIKYRQCVRIRYNPNIL